VNNLTLLGFTYRKVISLIVIIAMLYGTYSYFTMPAREDPVLVIRSAVVVANHPGLSAERMEHMVARPLEESIRLIPELENIDTTVTEGQVIIKVEVYFEYNELDQIWDELAEAVESARPNLPDNMGTISVNDDFGDVAVITAALTSKDYPINELYDFAQYARDQLIAVSGTHKVEILGQRTEQIYLTISQAKLAAADITVANLQTAIEQQNTIQFSGELITQDRRYLIESNGWYQSVEGLKNTLITSNDGNLVRLTDVAIISREYQDPPPRKAYFNGEPAVVLSIVMQPTQSAINYSKQAQAKLDDISAALPLGIDLNIVTFQADQVESAVYGVTVNVLQTLSIVLIVVIIFLGLRTGLVVGSIVPVVILMSIAVMAAMGIELQRMSLATLVISLGLLVDNGIVVAEDFQRRLVDGVERYKAMLQTGKELAFPLLSSSLTTMVFFMPLAMAQHGSAEYTLSISQVVIISLSLSWLIAITVTPTLCYFFVKTPTEDQKQRPSIVQRGFRRLENGYERCLKQILRFRWWFLAATLVIFVLGGMSMGWVENKFFPDSDRQQILVYLDLPEGVSTDQTDQAMHTIMHTVENHQTYPDFADYAAYVGFGGPRFVLSLEPVDPGNNVGFVVINLTTLDNVEGHMQTLRNELARQLPDAMLRVTKMFLGPQDPNTIQVQVKGPDAAHLKDIGDELAAMLGSINGTQYVWSDWYNEVEVLEVQINQTLAAQLGVTSQDVAQALAVLTTGEQVTRLIDSDKKIAVTLRGEYSQRRSIDYLKNALVNSQNGTAVPLSQIAELKMVPALGRVVRENLIRTVTVEAKNALVTPEDMVPMLAERLAKIKQDLKPGHSIEYDGAIIDSGKAQKAIGANAPLALGLISLLLLIQFNSFRSTGIIISIIPLSIIGAGLGLNLMSGTMGFMVILGMFALFGIVVNNAIVLIDRINIEIHERPDEPYQAVVSACVRRLRPILMATFTTILGLMPLIISGDVLFYDLSVVIAFGLGIGTILTLGVVPILYCLLNGIERRAPV
jgi:multidrug efflux pump subunit AcrB